MKRFSLQDVFIINQDTRSKSVPEITQRNYFEIIFVEKGKGRHFLFSQGRKETDSAGKAGEAGEEGSAAVGGACASGRGKSWL